MALAEGSINAPAIELSPGIGPGAARRALDVIVASAALVGLLAVLLVVALAVRMTSRGPVLFAQWRVGQGGRQFRMLKFRTMRHQAAGSALTAPGDARVTRLGRVLRATFLDETPQLLNVLLGHMTLVGPRPQTPGFAVRYPPHLRGVFAHRPGLTGPGVVRFNDEDVLPPGVVTSGWIEEYYLEHIVPRRVAADLAFCEDPSIRRVLGVLLATGFLPFRRLARQRAPERAPDALPVPPGRAARPLRPDPAMASRADLDRRATG